MGLRLPATVLLSLLLLASPVAAQDDPPEGDSSQIVVTGQRPREEQVRDFVSALTPVAGSGSIPRFIEQVCPVAVGLAPVQNERVAERLRQVVAAVGLDVAARGCAANAFVVVTRNKRDFIEALAEQRPYSFGQMTARQIRALARSKGPAAAWQLTGPVNQSNVPLHFDEAMGMYVNKTTEAASRVNSSTHQGFDASVVVVESGALSGLTATQLADYAAMRLLAKLDPARLPAPPPPTILNVLEAPVGSPVPITLTRWDLGFLRGLYSGSPSLYAGAQRSQIAKEVTEELTAPRKRKPQRR